MPRSAGMHKSGVRMVREKAMDGFFNNLLGICANALLQPFRNDLCNTRVNQVTH